MIMTSMRIEIIFKRRLLSIEGTDFYYRVHMKKNELSECQAYTTA